MNEHSQHRNFDTLGIDPGILQILHDRRFTTPTPIQQQSIPAGIQGKDIVGIAQTGTGKTFAFGIPMLQRLANGPGRGLVVLPTRELAYQVEESLKIFASALNIRTAVIVGGASMNLQKDMIRRNPRIVIATPGRLNDHLMQRTITLKEVSILVLDEADRMLDMGFRPQIEQILEHVPKDRQTMLFSATMPHEIMQLANEQMKLPLRIEVAPAGTAAELVQQELFIVQKAEKMQLLEHLLQEHEGTVLVFSRTKYGAKKITANLRRSGHTAAEIHANRSLAQRREALEGFKSGKYRVLVATDIAARGIDVAGIAVVVNYDLPDDANDYVHRIGRTARAGREGIAISFATPDQSGGIRTIEKLIRSQLKRKSLPSHLPPPPPLPAIQQDTSHRRGKDTSAPAHGARRNRRGFSGPRRRR
ncbi:MAG TPA: DEAD/DEAH box helicase [Candidatus Peribacteraceae bacterium]|nr:DEAD/DEAH box helicase [Candidatus Peribacteraceae bacterium]